MMLNILKGIIVICVALFLFMVSQTVKAGTPAEFLEIIKDKKVVYKGFCYFNKKGMLTMKAEEAMVTVRCIVGFEDGVTTRHYVAMYGDDLVAYSLIVYDEKDGTQTILWQRGTGV